jgi:hypothetical protein
VTVVWATSGAEGAALGEVVLRCIREQDEHVRRYMYVLDRMYSNTWAILQESHVSYDLVRVSSLWLSTARGSGPGRR